MNTATQTTNSSANAKAPAAATVNLSPTPLHKALLAVVRERLKKQINEVNIATGKADIRKLQELKNSSFYEHMDTSFIMFDFSNVLAKEAVVNFCKDCKRKRALKELKSIKVIVDIEQCIMCGLRHVAIPVTIGLDATDTVPIVRCPVHDKHTLLAYTKPTRLHDLHDLSVLKANIISNVAASPSDRQKFNSLVKNV
jgi:hypothetical protein